jgi:23S rRNA pseudouridine2605 synthase
MQHDAPADGVATPVAEGSTPEQAQQPMQGGYQPRNNYNRPQGGYQQRPGGYNRPQGGYQPRNNYGQQGGYQQRPGGYNRPNQQGGYQPRNNYGQQGGYNNQQGGYQPRNNYGQQGGYNNHQGGYMNNNRRPNGPGNRFQKGPIRQGKSFTPRPKRIEYELPLPDPDEKIRLNKFMANAGLCSRREADEFIQQGLVKVNGQVVTELGTKISHDDTVEYDEKVVALESKCYILLNKPKDCVTTSDDPNGRTTVLDLVKGACNERIYPVGRLDRNTTGVLLLTNDGDLASKLTHPKYVKKKIYHVWTDKDIAEEDMQRIADGIELEDGPIHADAISYATETDRNQAGIEIHSGRNRIVRRIFESLGYHVTKLDRVYFAGLTKKNLPRGRWRYLTQEEVNFLKMGSFE